MEEEAKTVFEEVFGKFTFAAIPNCPGRFVLKRKKTEPAIVFDDLVAGCKPLRVERVRTVNDPVWFYTFADQSRKHFFFFFVSSFLPCSSQVAV
jgi:hypothetical protein